MAYTSTLLNPKPMVYGSLQTPNKGFSSMSGTSSQPDYSKMVSTPTPATTATTNAASARNRVVPGGTQGLLKPPAQTPMASTLPSATPASQLTQGSSFTDTQGNQGVAQFDSMTGQKYGATAPTTPPVAPVTPPASTPQYSSTNQATFPGLVNSVGNQANTINQTAEQIGSQTQMSPAELQANLQAVNVEKARTSALSNAGTHGWDQMFAQGQEGLINRTADTQASLAQQEASKYATQRGVATQAYTGQANAQNQAGGMLNTAAGLVAPQLAGYNNQVFQPGTGQMSSGQSGGGASGTAMAQLPSQGQSAVTSYADQVKSGSMTRGDAESRLSAYGQPGLNALNEALGSGFNTNASNASAGTTAQGQQIKTAADSTNRALDTLSETFNSLPGWQTGGIPATNNIGQWLGQQFGDKELQSYKTNLADARSQLIGVLNSSGGTPTGNEATANQYLPDNMTKAMFDTNVGTAQNPGIVRQLVEQKVGSFTSSGSQINTNQNASSNNIFSW